MYSNIRWQISTVRTAVTFAACVADSLAPPTENASVAPPHTTCWAGFNLIEDKRYLVSGSCFSRVSGIHIHQNKCLSLHGKGTECLVVVAELVLPSMVVRSSDMTAAAAPMYWVITVMLGVVLSTVMCITAYSHLPVVRPVKMSFVSVCTQVIFTVS